MEEDPFTVRLDFALIAGGAAEAHGTALHLALRHAGFQCQQLLNSTDEWTRMGNQGSPHLFQFVKQARVTVFFYSQRDAEQSPFSAEFRRAVLISTLAPAASMGPIVVVVVDGVFPLGPQAPVPVIMQTGELVPQDLVAAVFKACGIALFARIVEESRLASLASVFRRGLVDAVNINKRRVMIFGPGQPKEGEQLSFSGLLWLAREQVQRQLSDSEVLAVFGEDLEDLPLSNFEAALNPALKEKLFAKQVDAVVILAGSVGSAAEVGVFSQLPDLARRCLVFVFEDHRDGFMAKGPAQECVNHGGVLQTFTQRELMDGTLVARIMAAVQSRLEAAVSRALLSSER